MSSKRIRSVWAAALGGLGFVCLLSSTEINSGQAETKAPEPKLAAATNAPLVEIGPGQYRLGRDVRLDKNTGAIQFPAVVNLTESPMEYLLVTTYGKIHESILRTEVKPHEIHVAMLLLGAQGASTNRWPESPDQDLPGDSISVSVSWQSPEGAVTRPAEDLVLDRKADATMARGIWRYNGSFVWQGTFLAEQEGSIISLISDQAALINNPGPSRENDDNWMPNAKALPSEETLVTVTVALNRSTTPKPN